MSVSEGTKNFHHSFKSKKWSEKPQNKAKQYFHFSFLFILFVYCPFDYYPQFTKANYFTHSFFFFSFCRTKEPRTILSITQIQICLLGVLFGPHSSPKVHELMNLFCGGHGINMIRTVVISASSASMLVDAFVAKLYTLSTVGAC